MTLGTMRLPAAAYKEISFFAWGLYPEPKKACGDESCWVKFPVSLRFPGILLSFVSRGFSENQ